MKCVRQVFESMWRYNTSFFFVEGRSRQRFALGCSQSSLAPETMSVSTMAAQQRQKSAASAQLMEVRGTCPSVPVLRRLHPPTVLHTPLDVPRAS